MTISPIEDTLILSLRERPSWRRDPKVVTFLKSAETDKKGNPRCASKRWFLTEGRREVRGYDRVKYWRPFVARSEGIEDLSRILTRAERYPNLLAVRGAIRDASAHKQIINRRCRARPDVKGGVNLDHFGGAKVDQLVKG